MEQDLEVNNAKSGIIHVYDYYARGIDVAEITPKILCRIVYVINYLLIL